MPDDLPQQQKSDVPSDHLLWRRIPKQFYLEDDNSESGYRISTQAFSNTTGTNGMSVINGTELREQGRTESDVFAAYNENSCFLIAEFSVKLAESLNQIVVRDAIPEEPCHCEVEGAKPRSVKKDFANMSSKIHRPD